MNSLVLTVALGACQVAVAPVQASETSPAVQQAWTLVQALGSDDYGTRVQAKNNLLSLGRPAIEPLEHAAQSDDAEVRTRAMEILVALRGRGFLGISFSPGLAFVEVDDEDERPPLKVHQVNGLHLPQQAQAAYWVTPAVRPFPAERAGILEGDLLLSINEHPVHSLANVIREVSIIGPGRVALVLLERDGKRIRIPVLLTSNPTDPPPPIDLEREVDPTMPPALPRPVGAAQTGAQMQVGGVRVIGGGRVIIGGQVRVIGGAAPVVLPPPAQPPRVVPAPVAPVPAGK